MITKFYPTSRKKPFVYTPPALQNQQPQAWQRPTAADKAKADLLKIKPEEFVRRDQIVSALWQAKPFYKGDVASPADPKHKTKYGTIVIKDIFQTYHAFPLKEAMEWPDDDEPYTITAESEKESGLILLHPSWLEAKTVKKGSECPAC